MGRDLIAARRADAKETLPQSKPVKICFTIYR
jgi:hypothetical protein